MSCLKLSVLGALCTPMVLSASPVQVHEAVLDNGLRILVQEDHRAPVAVTQVWYKVGSSYEHGGITGISHMLEHMMFKGTRHHPPGEFSRIISANGGSENAFTGQDYTAYFQTLGNDRLEVSFELEADRMRNLRLLRPEFIKEQQVVIEERRMRTDDQPQARLEEHFNAVAFSDSPYRNPVIGWPDDVAGLTVEDLQDWYQRWYAPNNATLVVVGDVQAANVFRMAKKWFGPLRSSSIPVLKPQAEVQQLGIRRMTMHIPAKLPHIVMAWKVPSLLTAFDDNDAYALEVLSGILDGGNSARFASSLVRGQQVAADTGVGYELMDRLSTLFSLEATPAEGHSTEELEVALRQQIERLKNELVGDDELARVKAQVLAGNIYQRDSMFYQAMQMGMAETVGLGWAKVDEYVDRVNAVNAGQIQRVVRRYFIDDHLSIATLDPLPIPKGSHIGEAAMSGGQHVR